jgi:SRSO17 transposase
MNLQGTDDSESRFYAYVEEIARVIGHADRRGPLHDYCVGLIMPGERKSVEPMAAITPPHGWLRSINHCCTSSGNRHGRIRAC